jgi:DNA-binding response OmpR family regulator
MEARLPIGAPARQPDMKANNSILIVDDDADIVAIVSAMLTGRGWQVRTAYDGETALSLVRREKPDVILLDIMMPRMNGLEVLKQVRQIAPESRIIMITAFGDVASYLDAMDLGACEYLNKPFDTAELLALIDKVVAA